MSKSSIQEATYQGEDYDRVPSDVASWSTAGWYDLLVQRTIDNYVAMKERGRDARLLIGPWTHAEFADPVGDREFGMRSGREAFLLDESESFLGRHLAWFRRHLHQDESAVVPDKPVRTFVMGPQRVARRGELAARRGGRRALVPSRRREPEPRRPRPGRGVERLQR